MLDFVWPWLLLLAPVPLLLRLYLKPLTPVQAALKVPFLDDFSGDENLSHKAPSGWSLLLVLMLLSWLLLLLAAARPQWQGAPVQLPMQGRDLLLAVDLSGSMKERDFVLNNRRINRLQATKLVAGEFIKQRQGDRLGLILFGEQAYLQVPLTFDLATVNTLLGESMINMAGRRTAIGDAIGLAIKRLQDTKGERVLILLSDGRNTAGAMKPLKAAELAAAEGMKIYTIGVGAARGSSFFGMATAGGDLDEATLSAVAKTTGGRYFRARNTSELVEIYQEIDQMEPVESEQKTYRPIAELFYWPLAVSLLLLCSVVLARRV